MCVNNVLSIIFDVLLIIMKFGEVSLMLFVEIFVLDVIIIIEKVGYYVIDIIEDFINVFYKFEVKI